MENDRKEEIKKYHYNENIFIEDLKQHVDKTNQTHYGGMIQPTEFIMSHANSLDFLLGNVIKYAFRYGRKNGYNKEDLMKACHYLMMMDFYSKQNKKD